MIDLSQFVNKNVTVTFRDGTTAEGNIGVNRDNLFYYKFKFVTSSNIDIDGLSFSYTGTGHFYVTQLDGRDIVAIEEIEEVKPAVDLSQFAGKSITATLRNGNRVTSRLTHRPTFSTSYPYDFAGILYTRDGRSIQHHERPNDIIAVEEVVLAPEKATEPVTEVNYKEKFMQIGTILGEAFPECEISTVDMARLVMDQLKTLRMAAGLPTFDQVRNQTNF